MDQLVGIGGPSHNEFQALSDQITSGTCSLTAGQNVTISVQNCWRVLNLVIINANIYPSVDITSGVILNLPYTAAGRIDVVLTPGDNTASNILCFCPNNSKELSRVIGTLSANKGYAVTFCYITNEPR